MFKKIALILVLVLVIGALCVVAFWDAFWTEINKPQKLEFSEAQKQAIGDACAKQGISPVNWDAKEHEPGAVRNYGTYQSYDVFLLIPQDQNMRYGYIRIGEYDFYLPFEKCNIYAYKDGKIEDVKELFEDGIFSSDVIREIITQHVLYDNDGLKSESSGGGVLPI